MAVPIIHSLDIFIDYLLYSGPLEGSGYSLVKKKEKSHKSNTVKRLIGNTTWSLS